MSPNAESLEELGRATLQIVHDLKNQLNGLKLYATFLRKRLEREDQFREERDTLTKLITGLDRAAKDMTALVRYAKPTELRRQSHTDLRKIVSSVIDDAASRETGGLPRAEIITHVPTEALWGEFDQAALTEAIKAVTDDMRAIVAKEPNTLSLDVRREANEDSNEVLIEWRGARMAKRAQTFGTEKAWATVQLALAARILEAHGGELKCDGDLVRARLPLSKQSNSE